MITLNDVLKTVIDKKNIDSIKLSIERIKERLEYSRNHNSDYKKIELSSSERTVEYAIIFDRNDRLTFTKFEGNLFTDEGNALIEYLIGMKDTIINYQGETGTWFVVEKYIY